MNGGARYHRRGWPSAKGRLVVYSYWVGLPEALARNSGIRQWLAPCADTFGGSPLNWPLGRSCLKSLTQWLQKPHGTAQYL